MPASLGFLLALSPKDVRYAGALALLERQVRQNLPAYLYCLADGVYAVAEPPIQELRSQGLRLFACAQGALQREIPLDDRATYGGLGLLTDLILGVDQFRSLAPGSDQDLGATDRPSTTGAVTKPGDRSVLVTLRSLAGDPKQTAEAVRVAAGLAIARRFPVLLALLKGDVKSWADLSDSTADAHMVEHLQMLREHEVQLAVVGSPDRSPPRAPLTELCLSHAAYRRLASTAFVLIPF